MIKTTIEITLTSSSNSHDKRMNIINKSQTKILAYLDKRLFKYNVRTSDSDNNILQIVNSSIEDIKGTYEVYPTKLTFNIEYKTQSELGSLLKTNERNKVRLLNTYVSKNNQEITSIVNKLVKNLNRWYSGNLINQEIKITNE